jgi:hypothetical protein
LAFEHVLILYNVFPRAEIVKGSSNAEAKTDLLKITHPFPTVVDCRNVFKALIHKGNSSQSIQYRDGQKCNVKN